MLATQHYNSIIGRIDNIERHLQALLKALTPAPAAPAPNAGGGIPHGLTGPAHSVKRTNYYCLCKTCNCPYELKYEIIPGECYHCTNDRPFTTTESC